MPTKCGVGFSSADAAARAGSEAVAAAIRQMGPGRADILFVFASSRYDHRLLLSGIRQVAGEVPLVGCTTAGEFTQDHVGHGCVAVMAVRSENIRFQLAIGRGLARDQRGAVIQAFGAFEAARREARSLGFDYATCFVCTDGLAGAGEDLVDRVHEVTGMRAQIVGGAAADDAKFTRTDVFYNDEHHTDALVAAFAFSRAPIGMGVRHGLKAGCESMIVTRADQNVLREIDGRPALRAYETFAAAMGEPLPVERRESFMIAHELGMLTPTGEYKIRAPLRANPDGSLSMASEVPTGAAVTIMKGTKEGLVTAAELAARSALGNLGGATPAGVLAFDCICRRMVLGDEYKRQVDAVRSVVGADVPIIGWETYGEIAMTPSQPTGWHNSTTVLAILPS